MNKEQYIRSRFRDILSETLEERVKGIQKNLSDELSLNMGHEFDYVQEGKETCNECGGMLEEGECKECGYKGDKEVMESGLKKLEKISSKEIEDLLGDIDSDLKKSHGKERKHHDDTEEIEFELELDESWYSHDEYERMRNFGSEDELQAYQDKLVSGGKKEKSKKEDDDEEFDFELDESWYSHDEYERMRNFGSEDELQAYQDKLVSGGKKEKSKKEDDDEEFDLSKEELDEKLYGKQHKLDRNKNGRIDKEDFKMLRKQQDEETLYEVEFEKEGETDESREFAYAAMMAKKKNKPTFELDGETFNVKESKTNESILYTESDLIDLIEKLVVEEKKKFKKSEPKGYREYEKVHKADKKENDNYLKSLAKKMTDYLKPVSDEGSKYEMKKTKKFPTENGGMKKGIRKKYTPSDAVDDYNDAFSYPGQTNLRFDEIKPNKKNIEKYLKGHRTTGNAQIDEDGNALGNVVPSNVGDKFFKNFEENLYGQEQAEASYKRQSQPVDVAGDDTEEGSLKSKRPKGGKGKSAQSVLNKLSESIEPKKIEKLNEEYNRIQQLMGYNRKTQ